jgi:hypothetical protein
MTTKTLSLIELAFLGVVVFGALHKHRDTPSPTVNSEVTTATPTPAPAPEPMQYIDQQPSAFPDEPIRDESRVIQKAEWERIEGTAKRDVDDLWLRALPVRATGKPIRLL